jgi:hypothetical protein
MLIVLCCGHNSPSVQFPHAWHLGSIPVGRNRFLTFFFKELLTYSRPLLNVTQSLFSYGSLYPSIYLHYFVHKSHDICIVAVRIVIYRNLASITIYLDFSHSSDTIFTCSVLTGPPLWSSGHLGYRSGGPGSIPGTTRKKSSGSGTGSTQPREYN